MVDVLIDVGHGRRPDGRMDWGTVGKDGRREHDEAHEVVVYAANALARSGVSLTTDNHGGGGHHDMNWQGSVGRANSMRVKCAVEVHWDANLGQNDGGFGLFHRGSSAGERLANAIAHGYRQRGLSVRWDGSITPQDIGRGDLGFLKNTSMPSVIWECGVIRDVSAIVNEQMGEAIAQGICSWLGKPFVAATNDDPTWRVVVAYEDERVAENTGGEGWDAACAHMLGGDNLFKVVPASVLREGKQTAGWVVGVGLNASGLADLGTQGGTAFSGGTRIGTVEEVLAAIQGPAPDRTRPWA